jgi:hypothetical protein
LKYIAMAIRYPLVVERARAYQRAECRVRAATRVALPGR